MNTDSPTLHSEQPVARSGGGLNRALDGLAAALALPCRLMRRAAHYLESARRYSVTARQLRALDDHTLRDIGVERDEIARLAGRLSRGGPMDWS